MTEIFRAMREFFSGLGIPVYPENSVPSDAVLPYLTWTPIQTDWETEALMPVRIWNRSYDYAKVSELADKLAAMIPADSGTTIPAGSGYIHLFREEPWCQPQPMQNSEMKVLYINIGISTMIP